MNNDEYKTPSSDLKINEELLKIKRPWTMYLVCFYLFLSSGNTFEGYILRIFNLILRHETLSMIASILVLYGFFIIVIIGMIKLKRIYIYSAGITFIITAFISVLRFFQLYDSDIDLTILITILIADIILCSLCAWYCLRSSFLEMADEFVKIKVLKPKNL